MSDERFHQVRITVGRHHANDEFVVRVDVEGFHSAEEAREHAERLLVYVRELHQSGGSVQ